MVSSFLGAKSVDEARADALVRNVKKELARDIEYKLSALDAIADRVQRGAKVDPSLFQQYVQFGGDPQRLGQNLVQRMKERSLTGVERMQEPQVTIPQAHRLNLLNDYLQMNQTIQPQQPMGLDPRSGQAVPISRAPGGGIQLASSDAPVEQVDVPGKRVWSDSTPPPSWADRVVKPHLRGTEDKGLIMRNPPIDADITLRPMPLPPENRMPWVKGKPSKYSM
jgi:hypothetical protein